ncbi:cupin domain-containing protein [Vibrio viridaestus]|uniref:Cupin domain-containing protein n=1 Tax=Vibrio viridaestus TaxID=2487322 RepID=A0A3N9TKA3_9VIBR|nr:cupin domain-containing protein [Vibrio viridaestus]RQW64818.1 cupin domain-containing protein [Vibrio viridaestus]
MTEESKHKSPIRADLVPQYEGKAFYPEPFASVVQGRKKRKLGEFFGLNNFGVNLSNLEPNSCSALKHHHSKQDEFIYIVSGNPTLIYGEEKIPMTAGECFGFAANTGIGHQLINQTDQTVTYIEVGDRTPHDSVEYPDDDLALKMDTNGGWRLTHKDGTPY